MLALSKGSRIALVAGIAILTTSACIALHRYLSRPIILTVAVGSTDSEAANLMSEIAARLAATKSQIRLKVIDKGTLLGVAKAFSSGEADLAVVRSDVGDLSSARTVALVAHAVVLIVVPPGGRIDGITDLKGKTVGVVGGEINHGVVSALTKEYQLDRANVHFRDIDTADVQSALKTRQLSALLVVMPISEKYLSVLRDLFPKQPKQSLALIAIESAGAIAAIARSYESVELPRGTIQGSPPVPDDDLTTLRIPFYLVAKSKLANDDITTLTKAIMDVRRELVGAYPPLAKISAPNTEKDALIPIHPGAATYYNGEEQSFLEKYGDSLTNGSMLLGTLASILAAFWKFIGFGAAPINPFNPLNDLADRIRQAANESELTAAEEELDNILKVELAKHADGDDDTADAGALSLALHRLEHLLNHRRSVLQATDSTVPARGAQ